MKKALEKLNHIPVEYKAVPFWSWNDELDPEVLKKQIRWMNDMGLGGFFMHARTGLKTGYLSKEWMNCIRECCDEAERIGMHAWAYDENGWPSGFAGGLLLEKEENRDMYLTCSTGAADWQADVVYLLTDDQMIRVSEQDGAADGEYLNLYIGRSVSTVDILNPDVVDQFLAATHEKYKEELGENFSSKIKGFFTDEPQYYRWNTAYTPMVREYFREQYNEEILDQLGLLFVEKEGYRSFRYRYWLAMQTLMLKHFAKKVYDWCDENGVQLTGHYIQEDTLGWQDLCCAGIMPFYEYEHIPGIDWLGRASENELPPRQLGSVVAQLGKKHALTENFAGCGWDISPAELFRIGGFQYVNGVNMMCHHLVPYSEHGNRKEDWPAHYHPVNPWINERFRDFNDYFSRLGRLLADGEEAVNVAMLHPIRSSYFDYKHDDPDYGTTDLDGKLMEACRALSSRGISYHFLDETLMEKYGFTEGASIGCGKCAYQYLVIPDIYTMGANTEKLIRRYVEAGGKVLLMGRAPEYLEGEPFEYTYLTSSCTLEEIMKAQPFRVENTDNRLFYACRRLEDTTFLFVQNASPEETYTQTFRFDGKIRSFTALDLITLETKQLPLTVTLPENGSLLLFPSEEEAPCLPALKPYDLRYTEAEVSFDTNFMTLYRIRYSKDGQNFSEPIPRAELFRKMLEERYEGRLWLKYDFEIAVRPEKLTLLAERNDNLEFFVNGQQITFDGALEEEPSLWKKDISTLVHEGMNAYEVMLDWHQSEQTYYALFGEGVTESLKNIIAYDSEIECAYLAGKFGVYSHDAFEPCSENRICSRNFYIGEVPTRISGEMAACGFPHFRGKMTLSQEFALETADTLLRVGGRYQLADVSVNGQAVGELFRDHQIDISSAARPGMNRIECTFTIGNNNLANTKQMSEPGKADWYVMERFYTEPEC